MSVQYKLTRLAEQDVESIAHYICKDNPASALEFTKEVERICQLLAKMPNLGADIPFIHSHDFLYFPAGKFKKFLIFYRKRRTHLEIIRVLHKHRDIEDLFDSDST